ncbi:hypothetical protein THAOC_14358 [Thalassiosira oceanica]|uniref:CRAL-TRIO domain-containing protein n=1 Tax=Thalassiosira oceanica TaxID=159749 RepID=K0SHM6_THAOC|nr:hypothetical protein THAOC_14358 [Thalassiosira oceanica]|eukprot:EJK64860.1 hypothetical protein THAOC_14358 [Thalassiosira oceanica]
MLCATTLLAIVALRRITPAACFSIDERDITSAGVEIIFSRNLWRPITGQRQRREDKLHGDLLPLDGLGELPQVDCAWACAADGGDELLGLRQMKKLLESDLKPIYESNLDVDFPDVYSDLRLLRFLRKDKPRNILSSVYRYKSFLQFRKESNVDEGIRKRLEIDSRNDTKMFKPRGLDQVSTYFPIYFDRLNEFGNGTMPTVTLNIGLFDTKRLSSLIQSSDSSVSLQTFLEYWTFVYEAIHLQLYHASLAAGEMAFLDEICDLSGLSLWQFGPYFVKNILKPWLDLTQSNYPETTRKIIVKNAPSIVGFAWNLVTPLLSEGTVNKITFVK